MSAKVIKVAKAVNSIIALGEQDQQALLEVIEDYLMMMESLHHPNADAPVASARK